MASFLISRRSACCLSLRWKTTRRPISFSIVTRTLLPTLYRQCVTETSPPSPPLLPSSPPPPWSVPWSSKTLKSCSWRWLAAAVAAAAMAAQLSTVAQLQQHQLSALSLQAHFTTVWGTEQCERSVHTVLMADKIEEKEKGGGESDAEAVAAATAATDTAC